MRTHADVTRCLHHMQERFLVEQQGLPGFFHVVARYGYNERVVQDANFVQVGHFSSLCCGSSCTRAATC